VRAPRQSLAVGGLVSPWLWFAAAANHSHPAVFELHYYLGLPQAEIAKTLNVHPRKISYLWIAATESLADQMAGLGA
jgi:DNA-directed RNA polymerase specialized sigma24 family protein